MNKRMGAVLALAVASGALYGALGVKTAVKAEAEATPTQTVQKPRLQLKRLPSMNGLKAPLPPLTKLDLKSLPPDAIPMNFNGGTVYWIPLNEKIPAQTKTRAAKTPTRKAG